MDHDRRKWTQFLYGVDWGDPALYDLLINLEHIGIERACGFVVSIIELGGFEFSPERQAAMNDLALASRVRAALAQDPYTLNLALEDEYFIKRKLYPNVDFYSGIIYQAIGFQARHVYRVVRHPTHGRLVGALGRADTGRGAEDRPPAPGLHGCGHAPSARRKTRRRFRQRRVTRRGAADGGASDPAA
jgi:hypothetical protein